MSKREICFDTETTGFNPKDGDRLVEIGCVEIIDGRRTENYFHKYINPQREVPESSVEVHGLTTEFLSDKELFNEIAQEFLDFIGNDGILIAHNAGFDMKFIDSELGRMGIGPVKNKVIDSLVLAKRRFPGQRNNLDALCKRFGIDLSRRVKHGALLDAELLADVYLELIGGAQDSMFKVDILSDDNPGLNSELFRKVLEEAKNKKPMKSRNFDLTEEEIKRHKEFIEKHIKEALWFERE